ncbi:hypothetical protein F383_36947 [Gossypium arboreum]|uniref:Uncharacterized protein n=1 Tax=Gossypium arboreum TaxID=29729 RepID=A0A0B0NE07_GOSAR|nr:hypothetical protein F383_36947 [Gossypium arboreum]
MINPASEMDQSASLG